ncbi:MAG: guanitoxin biosynthesis heme-dependent pre-guanitoxin N-hydroxylase GntA [Lapillicoccus sp.]
MTDLAPVVSDPSRASDAQLMTAFTQMVEHPDYPCLGARSVFRQENATVRVYDELATPDGTRRLGADLTDYVKRLGARAAGGPFVSFVAVFRGPGITDERAFEDLLWRQLRQLHREDDTEWSTDVASDPEDPHFAFSVAGTPFFIVGLHPASSRDARRAPTPTLVFNLHEQFVELRASGHFPRMRDAIRSRDEGLQGSLNPMVDDFGGSSEARQYSGRHVGDDWIAPFVEEA